MGTIDRLIKERRKENIDDLTKVFGPIDERIKRPFVQLIYDQCYPAVLKQHPYWQEAASLTKILTAKQLEDFIKGEAEAAQAEAATEISEVVTESEPEPQAEPEVPAPTGVRRRTRFT